MSLFMSVGGTTAIGTISLGWVGYAFICAFVRGGALIVGVASVANIRVLAIGGKSISDKHEIGTLHFLPCAGQTVFRFSSPQERHFPVGGQQLTRFRVFPPPRTVALRPHCFSLGETHLVPTHRVLQPPSSGSGSDLTNFLTLPCPRFGDRQVRRK
jgi:hypothetical protein